MSNSWDYASIYVPLKNIIEKEFSLPVTIENDATSACFGEQWLDLEPGIKNLIYMFSGVGCGIMINGEIYTGSSGSAGEVSIYNPKDESPFSCNAGNPCFLKRWDIDFGLPQEARYCRRDKRVKISSGRIMELADNKPEDISLKHIFHAARENDPLASELLDRAAKQFGIKVAYLVNLLNPEVVVVGGGLEQAGERFLNVVKSTVDAWAFEEMSSGCA